MSARKASPTGGDAPARERRPGRASKATTPGGAAAPSAPAAPVRLFEPCSACIGKEKRGCPACRQSGMVWRSLTEEDLRRSVLDGQMHCEDVVAILAWRRAAP